MKVKVSRKAHFNAAHRLYRKDWDDDKNDHVFGKCNNPNFHGHNYEVIVKLTGEIDPRTGYLFDLGKLKKIIEQHIIQYFDHRNLNLDIPEFKELNPTVENIAVVIWERLRPDIPENLEMNVILYETERNFVQYPA